MVSNQYKILVVDDESLLVQLCKLIFEQEGFDVRGAYNGRQALHLVNEELPDLVLLDVMMPGMNGIEVCRHIRAQYPAPKPTILMYTADDRTETREASLQAGADEVLSKSTPPLELPKKIAAYAVSQPVDHPFDLSA